MEKILHKHHIIPKHAGGTEDESNLVYLTIEQHAEAHRLLYEQYGRKEDYLAWCGLAGLIGKDEMLKEKMSLNSARPGELNPFYGMKHTEETKRKISNSRKGKNVGVVNNKWLPEARQKISESRKKNSAKYNFKHPEHGEFYGTTGDLARAYDFSRTSEAYKLVKGEYKSYKGWTL
jgi:hypothetical protein